jgi:hypothetical protein
MGHEPAYGGGFAGAKAAGNDVRPCYARRCQSETILALLSCGAARLALANMAVGRFMSGFGRQLQAFSHLARMLLDLLGVL